MKNAIIKEKMDFNEYCKKAMKEAIITAAAFVASLNLTNLKTQNRLGRIYIENDSLQDEIELLNRVNYVLNIMDLPALFLIFDRMNFLHNAEELAKLKQAFILVEKHNSINKQIFETLATQEEENFHARLWALKAMDNINGLDKKSYEENNLHAEEDPHKAYQQFSEKSIEPISKIIKDQFSFGYTLPDDRLVYLIYELIVQIHLLAPETNIETFYVIITCKDWTIFKEKIYLGCKNTEFKYIINRLKKYFSSLSMAKIGRSELFVSNSGHLINNSNLTSTKLKKVSTIEMIDKIFREFDKKYCCN